ncbi:hypothetical protein SASPL_147568 [Salvia splendens]|uniref:Uncharacterized protein n=1 Tax=Salvia splendens TaxID=180675 RepID=A0A8X8Z6U0_SALSN|nr:hypothetical protein SASPL_147568 [Salvia splendens]
MILGVHLGFLDEEMAKSFFAGLLTMCILKEGNLSQHPYGLEDDRILTWEVWSAAALFLGSLYQARSVFQYPKFAWDEVSSRLQRLTDLSSIERAPVNEYVNYCHRCHCFRTHMLLV